MCRNLWQGLGIAERDVERAARASQVQGPKSQGGESPAVRVATSESDQTDAAGPKRQTPDTKHETPNPKRKSRNSQPARRRRKSRPRAPSPHGMEAFLLVHEHGWTQDQVAAKLGIKQSSVCKLLKRAERCLAAGGVPRRDRDLPPADQLRLALMVELAELSALQREAEELMAEARRPYKAVVTVRERKGEEPQIDTQWRREPPRIGGINGRRMLSNRMSQARQALAAAAAAAGMTNDQVPMTTGIPNSKSAIPNAAAPTPPSNTPPNGALYSACALAPTMDPQTHDRWCRMDGGKRSCGKGCPHAGLPSLAERTAYWRYHALGLEHGIGDPQRRDFVRRLEEADEMALQAEAMAEAVQCRMQSAECRVAEETATDQVSMTKDQVPRTKDQTPDQCRMQSAECRVAEGTTTDQVSMTKSQVPMTKEIPNLKSQICNAAAAVTLHSAFCTLHSARRHYLALLLEHDTDYSAGQRELLLAHYDAAKGEFDWQCRPDEDLAWVMEDGKDQCGMRSAECGVGADIREGEGIEGGGESERPTLPLSHSPSPSLAAPHSAVGTPHLEAPPVTIPPELRKNWLEAPVSRQVVFVRQDGAIHTGDTLDDMASDQSSIVICEQVEDVVKEETSDGEQETGDGEQETGDGASPPVSCHLSPVPSASPLTAAEREALFARARREVGQEGFVVLGLSGQVYIGRTLGTCGLAQRGILFLRELCHTAPPWGDFSWANHRPKPRKPAAK